MQITNVNFALGGMNVQTWDPPPYVPPQYLWAWGGNSYGRLGLGNTTSVSSPVQIGALTTWSVLAAGGSFSAAIKTDGTMWSWGANGQGSLGVGDTTGRSSPVQIGDLTTWLSVTAGNYHTRAISN